MPEKAIDQRSYLKWILIGAGWTLFALFFASEIVITRIGTLNACLPS